MKTDPRGANWRWGLLVVTLSFMLTWGHDGARPAIATGNSITSPDTNGFVGLFSSVALDGSSNPVVSYMGCPVLGDCDLKVLHCNDLNCDGGDESVTSPDTLGDLGLFTSLALDANGNPVVSYWDRDNGDLKVLHCNDPNCGGGGESITAPDTFGNVGQHTSLQLDAVGSPVVSYIGNGLKVLHCNDANCSGGDESITSPAPGSADTSLALDASGNPVVSYVDPGPRDLAVMHCNDPNCSGGDESITSLDTDGNVGSTSSLALDANGYPVVSYLDATNLDLKLAHCGDANCTAGNSIVTLDTDGDVGSATSVVLDANGNPVISYYDFSNEDLKVLHCNDPNCSGGDESITSPDPGGNTGSSGGPRSLVLDSNGNPVISYVDGTNIDLKVLHCSDPSCTGVKAGPTPTPIGGSGLFMDIADTRLETAEVSSGASAGGRAGAIAGAVVAGSATLGGAVWYVRRRRFG